MNARIVVYLSDSDLLSRRMAFLRSIQVASRGALHINGFGIR